MGLKRWLPVIVVGLILIGAVLALVLVLRNNAAERARQEVAETKRKAGQIADKINAMIEAVRLSDSERAKVQANGTGERGWAKTAQFVMAKNPMSLRAFRASRAPIQAFQVFVRIEEITDWGDWAGRSSELLGFSLQEYDGADGGFAVVDKHSDNGQELFTLTKDGELHPIIAVMGFKEGHKDPVILFWDAP